MPEKDSTRPARAIQSALIRSERFWAQDVYAAVRAVPGKDGGRYRLFHRLIGMTRRLPGRTWILMAVATLFLSGRWFAKGSAPVLSLSLSSNNDRVLAPVEEMIARHFGLSAVTGRDRPTLTARIRALGGLAQAAAAKKAAPAPLDDYTEMKQYLTAANTLLFLDAFDRARPRLVLTANDHAAPAMAFQAAASILGIPCVYVQHAPVTPNFPPLVCDLAVLSDGYSKDCYAQSARDWASDSTARVCILPRAEAEAPVADRTLTLPLKICIVLSHHPEMSAVEELVRELQGFATVGEITIRKHPRWRGAIHLPGCRVEDGEDALEARDPGGLYILANSGSAVELLRSGQPTMFHDALDSLYPDYYGLVARGLLPRYDAGAISSKDRLDAVFGAEWRTRLEALAGVPEAKVEQAKAALAQALGKLLNP